MGCCKSISKFLVLGSSIAILVFSLIALGYSGYVFNELGTELNELDVQAPLLLGIITAVTALVFSLVGILGFWCESRILLFVYSIGCIVVSGALLVAGAVFLSQSEDVQGSALQDVDDGLEDRVKHFQIAIFAVCCDDQNIGVFDDLDCDTFNDVQPCADDEDLFDDFVNFLGDANAATCQLLQETEVDDEVFVNADDPGDDDICEEGMQEFVDELSDYLSGVMREFGIASVVSSVFMLAVAIASCVLVCANKDDDDKK